MSTLRAFSRSVWIVLLLTAGLPMAYILKTLRLERSLSVVHSTLSAMIVKIGGIRLVVKGETALDNTPTLFISNHTSYLDCILLQSLIKIKLAWIAGAFVKTLPFASIVLSSTAIVYVDKRRNKAIKQYRERIREIIASGRSLFLFPEGTVSDGQHVLPFKSALFSAVEGGERVRIQPISVIATHLDGLPITRVYRYLYTWYGDIPLFIHIWLFLKLRRITVQVTYHPPIENIDKTRKQIRDYCENVIRQGVQAALKGY